VKRHQIAGVLTCLLLTAGAASAQEKGQNGIAMGFPSSIGFMWHPSENIGLRPEVSFARISNDTNSGTFSSSGHTWNFTVGASGLFYFHKIESLRPYFSPRFTYGHATSTSDGASDVVNGSTELTLNTYTTSGSIGVQYAISRRFGVFGETGITYSHLTQESSFGTEGSSDAFGNRSAVGVILYFK
jgi:hypothetical protein